MKTIKINTYSKKIIADTITPVEVYLKIRDSYPNSILLESSDYMQAEVITRQADRREQKKE